MSPSPTEVMHMAKRILCTQWAYVIAKEPTTLRKTPILLLDGWQICPAFCRKKTLSLLFWSGTNVPSILEGKSISVFQGILYANILENIIWDKSYPNTCRNAIENCSLTGCLLFIYILINKKKKPTECSLYPSHSTQGGVTVMQYTVPELKNPIVFLIDTVNLTAHFRNNGDF